VRRLARRKKNIVTVLHERQRQKHGKRQKTTQTQINRQQHKQERKQNTL
jgi:ACT domain-containing protein